MHKISQPECYQYRFKHKVRPEVLLDGLGGVACKARNASFYFRLHARAIPTLPRLVAAIFPDSGG
jgi:hypothetical protein